ncbi:hypothetical protein [Azorhizobium doebereinerae]|uniref:hypothetical protein n=1 Tax=Azorhizobium doebereinerae TaxID=281091 RepID=UPI000417E01B|nr:hypothetical protein [Azorhizobium doebereinerae]
MRPNCLSAGTASRFLGLAVLAVAAGGARAEDVKTTITRDVNSDGSSAVYVTNTPAWLDGAKFGVDLSLSAATVNTVQPNRALPWDVSDTSAAAAWAKMSLPTEAQWLPWQQTTLEMRVDPTQNAGKVGTTFSREMKLTDHMTASINDSYALVHSADASSGWELGKSVSVKLPDTGTTFSVGATNTSGERAWLPSASAEQKLIGPLNLTTTVENTGTEISKSITAGFKHNW